MKRNVVGMVVLGCLVAAAVAMAQARTESGVPGRGFGYGGPPQSAQERAARQTVCLERNGGLCPQGGPRIEYPRLGRGQDGAKGYGHGRGLRDGTGPRSGGGICPWGNTPAPRIRQ